MHFHLDCRQDCCCAIHVAAPHQWGVQALLTRLTERQCQGEVALAYIADRWGSQEGGGSDVPGADG